MDETLKTLTALGFQHIDPETVYEGKDGLLRCKKCGHLRTMSLMWIDEPKIVPVICPCVEAEDQRREQEARQNAARIRRRQNLLSPSDMDQTFANDDRRDPKTSDALRAYAEHWEGYRDFGLLLYGGVGTGKTFYANCIANSLMDRGISTLVTNFPTIINRLQASFEGQEAYLDSLNRNELLVIDDLGVERQSDYMTEQVYQIVNRRYLARRAMIVTTNLDIDEIKNPKTKERKRIYDRVLEMCHPIEIGGGSRRRKAVREHYAERNAALGLGS